MEKLFEKLQYAKNSTIYLLDHGDAMVDWHGLAYWASEVERLRKEIKESL